MTTPPPLPPPPPGLPPVLPPALPPDPNPRPGTSALPKVLLVVAAGVVAVVLLPIVLAIGLGAHRASKGQNRHPTAGSEFFHEATLKIGPRGVAASGNTDLAKDLATDMSELMQ